MQIWIGKLSIFKSLWFDVLLNETLLGSQVALLSEIRSRICTKTNPLIYLMSTDN